MVKVGPVGDVSKDARPAFCAGSESAAYLFATPASTAAVAGVCAESVRTSDGVEAPARFGEEPHAQHVISLYIAHARSPREHILTCAD